jgi:CheY-like chemotaxis protein
VASGGEQALVIVRIWRPDVPILDLDVDGVSGVELATRMRHEVAGPITLVGVTRVGANGDVAPMNASAFDHVFLKPADLTDLMGLLNARTHAAGCRNDIASES